MHKPRVILADDHAIVREGLALLLDAEVELVAMVSNGQELVEAALRLKPDIVVADLTMPLMGGLDALKALRAEGISSRFVILTVARRAGMAAEAMRAGATGYVVKEAAGEELVEAIRHANAGRTYLSPLVAGAVVERLAQGVPARVRLLLRGSARYSAAWPRASGSRRSPRSSASRSARSRPTSMSSCTCWASTTPWIWSSSPSDRASSVPDPYPP